jgi:hypothetical protein
VENKTVNHRQKWNQQQMASAAEFANENKQNGTVFFALNSFFFDSMVSG